MMVYTDKIAFRKISSPPGVLVGIDYSTHSVGVAVSDHKQTLSSPLTTLKNYGHKKLLATLLDAVKEYTPIGYVIGWPLQFNGDEGVLCPSIKTFATLVLESTQKPILLMDERFTSKIAMSLLAQSQKTQKKKKKIVDKIAASVILESAL